MIVLCSYQQTLEKKCFFVNNWSIKMLFKYMKNCFKASIWRFSEKKRMKSSVLKVYHSSAFQSISVRSVYIKISITVAVFLKISTFVYYRIRNNNNEGNIYRSNSKFEYIIQRYLILANCIFNNNAKGHIFS